MFESKFFWKSISVRLYSVSIDEKRSELTTTFSVNDAQEYLNERLNTFLNRIIKLKNFLINRVEEILIKIHYYNCTQVRVEIKTPKNFYLFPITFCPELNQL